MPIRSLFSLSKKLKNSSYFNKQSIRNINCSNESPKRGVPVMKGSGDHTWVELDIMSQEQYEELEELKKKSSKLDNIKD